MSGHADYVVPPLTNRVWRGMWEFSDERWPHQIHDLDAWIYVDASGMPVIVEFDMSDTRERVAINADVLSRIIEAWVELSMRCDPLLAHRRRRAYVYERHREHQLNPYQSRAIYRRYEWWQYFGPWERRYQRYRSRFRI